MGKNKGGHRGNGGSMSKRSQRGQAHVGGFANIFGSNAQLGSWAAQALFQAAAAQAWQQGGGSHAGSGQKKKGKKQKKAGRNSHGGGADNSFEELRHAMEFVSSLSSSWGSGAQRTKNQGNKMIIRPTAKPTPKATAKPTAKSTARGSAKKTTAPANPTSRYSKLAKSLQKSKQAPPLKALPLKSETVREGMSEVIDAHARGIPLSKMLPKLLELSAKSSGLREYGEVVAMCVEYDVTLEAMDFATLLVILTTRVPVPIGMVRLTLNFAIPTDGQVVPLIPPHSTEEETRAVFEDGEVIQNGASGRFATSKRDAVALAPASLKVLKEAGPRADYRDHDEEQCARDALSQVDPSDLRGRVSVRDRATAAYFAHFTALLHIETMVELQAAKRRLQRPIEDLERYGWALRGLSVVQCETRIKGKSKTLTLPGKDGASKTTRMVLAFPQGYDVTTLRMKSGDSVLISRTNPMEDLLCEGMVSEVPIEEDADDTVIQKRDPTIVITFDGDFDEKEGQTKLWRLDKGPNRTAYERQFLALLWLTTAKDDKRCKVWDILTSGKVGGDNVDVWANKMRGLLDAQQKAALEAAVLDSVDSSADGEGELPKPKRPRVGQIDPKASPEAKRLMMMAKQEPALDNKAALYSVRQHLKNGTVDDQLNPSQAEAVSAALSRRLTLIQGPPGTGKTTVSVKLLETWAQHLQVRPVLATSDSNIAVDNIAEGCQKLGLKVVRLGRTEKITSHLEDVTLETLVQQVRAEKGEKGRKCGKGGKGGKSGEDETDFEDVSEVPDDVKAKGKSGKGKSKGKEVLDAEARRRRRTEDFELKMKILKEADVVCTTTIASGSDFLHLLKFGAIIIDEVAQATELSTLVPIALRGAERLVLVGDHCQLPPSVLSLEAETRGLSLSIFGRLAAQGLSPYFLDTQFRMHPMIAAFSAEEFYHGMLRSGVPAELRPPPLGFQWPKPMCGIAFVHVGSPEVREGESRTNPGEAYRVMQILSAVLMEKELSVLDIGVVSPYAAQVRELRTQLRRELPNRLRGTGVDLTGGLSGRRAARALEIASVDAYQGREKELIVFSAVRSNKAGRVGFLQDWRRLNVMITRARRGLIVIGNTETLRGDPIWGRWLHWATEEGLIVDAGEQGNSERSNYQCHQAAASSDSFYDLSKWSGNSNWQSSRDAKSSSSWQTWDYARSSSSDYARSSSYGYKSDYAKRQSYGYDSDYAGSSRHWQNSDAATSSRSGRTWDEAKRSTYEQDSDSAQSSSWAQSWDHAQSSDAAQRQSFVRSSDVGRNASSALPSEAPSSNPSAMAPQGGTQQPQSFMEQGSQSQAYGSGQAHVGHALGHSGFAQGRFQAQSARQPQDAYQAWYQRY